jgi:hypothetical protein
VQWDALYVRIVDTATRELLREHAREKPGGYRRRR